jgi:hypothetical protein
VIVIAHVIVIALVHGNDHVIVIAHVIVAVIVAVAVIVSDACRRA